MHQAVVEVGTDICQDIDGGPLRDVSILRKTIAEIAGSLGYAMGASGTHPFSHWESQLITDHARYNEIVNELQEAARKQPDLRAARAWACRPARWPTTSPTARAISCRISTPSAPTPLSGDRGRSTGYKSFRTKVLTNSPTGIPDNFESIRGL